MAALEKTLSLVVCFLACLQLTYSEELKPFVAWSNSDVLSSIKPSASASHMVNAISNDGKKLDLFVVFLADELSFDDIVKHGDVYSNSKAAGDFAHLKSALSSSKSQLWSGVSDSTDDISTTLASLLNLDITTYDSKDIGSTDVSTWRGVVTIVMNNEQTIQAQDAVLGTVEKSLKNVQYVAIYSKSEFSTEQRSRRDVAPQPHLGKRAAAASDGDTSGGDACSVGGAFYGNSTNSSKGDACMLFCIKNFQQSINMTIKLGGNTSYCLLTHPSSVSYCCQSDLNNATECAGERFPFVAVRYEGLTSENRSADNMTNQCQRYLFGNLTQDIGSTEPLANATAVLKFVFPNNFKVNHTDSYDNAWNMRIIPSITYLDTNGAIAHTSTVNISYARRPPNMNLYEEFQVPNGLSYACGASDYQRYVPEILNHTNNNTDPLKSRLPANNVSLISNGDVEMFILPFIQVQPYKIRASSSSFSEAYNCIGYFTYSSLMGVFTTVVLLLILYVSLLCSFSMNSIDRFEDPRGQTITVEKLH